jgi:tetratricopeptide (TPR) repeat protein
MGFNMIMRLRVFWIITLLVIISSCSSKSDKAKEFYDAGDYDSAIEMFSSALEDNSEDVEARLGLIAARKRWINNKLIIVRQSRLSENYLTALDLMMEILKNQKNWGLSPQDAAFSTQKEETDMLAIYLKKKIQAKLIKHPLVARQLLDRYEIFFEEGKKMELFKALISLAKRSGAKQCDLLIKKSDPSYPYFLSYTNQYCNFWGISSGNRDLASLTVADKNLFSSIKLSGNIDGIPPKVISLLESKVDYGFKKSPWYNQKSQNTMIVDIQGSFVHKYLKEPTTLMESYSVQIPYTDYSSRLESYQEPYSSTETIYNYQTGNSVQVPVTKYRTQYKTVTVPITRYRSEERFQSIAGFNYHQTLLISGELKIVAGRSSIIIPLNDQYTVTGTAHDVSLPKIGIKPKEEKSFEPLIWLDNALTMGTSDLGQKLDDSWKSNFCRNTISSADSKEFIEGIYRCHRSQTASSSQEADNWFKRNHGLGYLKFRELVDVSSNLIDDELF